ncbi:MAG: hypothetical protein IMF05_07525, partial [Proteobacteria bacterium]|nr:hypothetical protein [Pseudomonadota bacterium]
MKEKARIAQEQEDARATVEQFLGHLEGNIHRLEDSSKISVLDAEDIGFDQYNKFRNLTGECLSFLVIIDRHLSNCEKAKAKELKIRLDKLTVAIWSVILVGSLGFLEAISGKDRLPIGTRDIFIHELKTMSDAEKTLNDIQYE